MRKLGRIDKDSLMRAVTGLVRDFEPVEVVRKGKTNSMLQKVVEVAREGKEVVVYVHNANFARELSYRLIDQYDAVVSGSRLRVDRGHILVKPIPRDFDWNRGRERGYSRDTVVFIDHFVHEQRQSLHMKKSLLNRGPVETKK